MLRSIVIVGLVLRLLLVIAAEESTCQNHVEYLPAEGNNGDKILSVKVPSSRIDGDLQLSLNVTVPFPSHEFQRNVFTLQIKETEATSAGQICGSDPLRYRIEILPGTANSTALAPKMSLTGERFVPRKSTKSTVRGKKTSSKLETLTSTVETRSTPTIATEQAATLTAANQSIPSDCGRTTITTSLNNSQEVALSRGQFPWHVAVFFLQGEYNYHCAGILVTNTHFITAASCFEGSGEWLLMSRFRVSVGHYRLRDWEEADAQNRYIRDFTAHPRYEIGKKNYGVNLAVVTLSERVEFTPFVQPICLWSSTSNTNRTTNLSGYVVGWGKDEFDNSNIGSVPRMTKYSLVQKEICLKDKNVFLTSDNSRTFCVKKQGSNVLCNIDEGSGLFVQDLVTGQFHLRGILSKLLYDHSVLNCYTAEYAIYVDLARHSKWLEEQLAQ